MLKTVFIGSKFDFDDMLVHWLACHTNLVGAVWIDSVSWQNTWRGRFKFACRRFRRRGFLGTIDEILLYFYLHTFVVPREICELQRKVINPYWATHGNERWSGDAIFDSNVNGPKVWSFLEERKPDLAFAMCVNNYFGKKIRSIPRLGVFLWHEGITPEYKGLYSPFWAVYNLDFAAVGYTLLKMNDAYDAGDVYVQGTVTEVDFVRHHHAFIGHKAIYDSLPRVKEFLEALERGEAKPIVRPNAVPKYYSYPGLTDFIRQRLRLRCYLKSMEKLGVKDSLR
jgi:hypothetical protein